MILELKRFTPSVDYIIGLFSINGEYFCDCLEPINCISTGEYGVIETYSEHFKRVLPLLVGVPNRTAIRIHEGNTVKDTTGCILLGENTKKGTLTNSRHYVDILTERCHKEIGVKIKIEGR
jgi:hypothetical protein